MNEIGEATLKQKAIAYPEQSHTIKIQNSKPNRKQYKNISNCLIFMAKTVKILWIDVEISRHNEMICAKNIKANDLI